MRAFLDTNVLVRHLTGDPSSQARRATALLAGTHELILTDLVFAELICVLESFYGRPRDEIATLGRSLLALDSIISADDLLLYRAMDLYESRRLDVAEAYLAAATEASGVGRIASFDRRLDRVGSVKRVEP